MRYTFIEHPSRAGWYSVLDSQSGLLCCFEEHRFNETQEFDLGDMPADPDVIAKAMRELGDWLSLHHYSEAMPVPTYEYRISEDNETVSIIRHKPPFFRIEAAANQDTTSAQFADAIRKAGEFIRKGRHQ